MKLIIQSNKLTVEELAYLYIKDKNIDYKKINSINNEERNKLLENITKQTEEEINNLTERYRDCFKDGRGRSLSPGVLGNRQALKKRLKEFKTLYSYTDNEIIRAITNYVRSEAKNNYKYLQKTHFTVKKRIDGIWESRLLTFCEELEEDNDEEMYDTV